MGAEPERGTGAPDAQPPEAMPPDTPSPHAQPPDAQPPVAAIVLAAGAGRRLGGQPKALLRHHGEYLVDRAVRIAREGGCEPVIAVLGASADEILRLAHPDTAAGAVVNPDWESGLGSSLRAGLAAVPATAGAALILLADQPFVSAEAVARVLRAHRAGADLAAAAYAGRRGHPVLVAARHLAQVAASATGDGGARGFLRDHEAGIALVDCTGAGRPADIDEPADLGLLER